MFHLILLYISELRMCSITLLYIVLMLHYYKVLSFILFYRLFPLPKRSSSDVHNHPLNQEEMQASINIYRQKQNPETD